MDKVLIVRLIVSIVAVVNSVCAMAGIPLLDLGEDQITMTVDIAALVGAWAWGFWKNNSFTPAARAGDRVTKAVKEAQRSSADDVSVEVVVGGKE